jgi:hypothetical protein
MVALARGPGGSAAPDLYPHFPETINAYSAGPFQCLQNSCSTIELRRRALRQSTRPIVNSTGTQPELTGSAAIQREPMEATGFDGAATGNLGMLTAWRTRRDHSPVRSIGRLSPARPYRLARVRDAIELFILERRADKSSHPPSADTMATGSQFIDYHLLF